MTPGAQVVFQRIRRWFRSVLLADPPLHQLSAHDAGSVHDDGHQGDGVARRPAFAGGLDGDHAAPRSAEALGRKAEAVALAKASEAMRH